MCTEKIQSFDDCSCSIRVINLCDIHAEHTRRHIDDKPCPKLSGKREMLENRSCGKTPCVAKRRTMYVSGSHRKGLRRVPSNDVWFVGLEEAEEGEEEENESAVVLEE
jgi:hypothetical protein